MIQKNNLDDKNEQEVNNEGLETSNGCFEHEIAKRENIGSCDNLDWIAAIASKLDSLGRDMKKLKENVHVIQVGCQTYEGPYLDKEYLLNEEVKGVEEVEYREFRRSALFKRGNLTKVHVETQIERLTKELHAKTASEAPNSSIGQRKAVYVDSEMLINPTSSNEINKLHGVSFLSDTEKMKSKQSLDFYVMADLDASVNVMPRAEEIPLNLASRNVPPLGPDNEKINNMQDRFSDYVQEQGNKKKKLRIDKNIPIIHFGRPIKQELNRTVKMWPSCDPAKKVCNGGDRIYEINRLGNLRYWYCNYGNERKNIKGGVLSFRDFLLVRNGDRQKVDLIWDRRHTDVCESVKKTLFKSWIINCFKGELGPDKDPRVRTFSDYKWVFDLEIGQLADEYKIGI
ncbi:hypothetical protein Tco_0053008 [Tanacetum coccineum]